MLINQHIWFGWLFWVATAILVVNLIIMTSINAVGFTLFVPQKGARELPIKVHGIGILQKYYL